MAKVRYAHRTIQSSSWRAFHCSACHYTSLAVDTVDDKEYIICSCCFLGVFSQPIKWDEIISLRPPDDHLGSTAHLKPLFVRLQFEDLQQPRVCRSSCPVGQPGLWGGLPAHPDVHHSHEFCQRMGRRVQVNLRVGSEQAWAGWVTAKECGRHAVGGKRVSETLARGIPKRPESCLCFCHPGWLQNGDEKFSVCKSKLQSIVKAAIRGGRDCLGDSASFRSVAKLFWGIFY